MQYSTWAESTLWSGSRLEDTRLTRRPPSPAVTRIQEVAPGLESRISWQSSVICCENYCDIDTFTLQVT